MAAQLVGAQLPVSRRPVTALISTRKRNALVILHNVTPAVMVKNFVFVVVIASSLFCSGMMIYLEVNKNWYTLDFRYVTFNY